jgi:hypothetical protein
MWIPNDLDDYKDLEPMIIIPQNKNDHLTWRILRYFVCSGPTAPSPGRGLRVIVMDKKTMTFLGIMELASDFAALKPRDDYIGWSKEHKEVNKRLNYLAMGSTIVPTQPLGYNYVGGKFMSLLLCSDEIEKAWNAKYKEPMLAITTTSMYGGFSQYNSLKYWKKCGSTEGKIRLEPDDEVGLKLRHWMRDNYPENFAIADKGSRPKSRINNFCYSKFGVKPPDNKAPRGVYFCELYDNVKPFLRMETEDYGERKFDNSLSSLVKLWKERYAKKRIENIIKTDRYNKDILFYDDMIGMSWEDSRDKYLSGIKR